MRRLQSQGGFDFLLPLRRHEFVDRHHHAAGSGSVDFPDINSVCGSPRWFDSGTSVLLQTDCAAEELLEAEQWFLFPLGSANAFSSDAVFMRVLATKGSFSK